MFENQQGCPQKAVWGTHLAQASRRQVETGTDRSCQRIQLILRYLETVQEK
jgi:hypothetical protein